MKPPWFTERLLDSFIADARISEDILGDLSEEWHERANRDGTRTANWWYRKQAARSVMHLIRQGWRQLPGIAFFGAALVVTVPVLLYTGRASMMTFIGDIGMSMFGHGGGESGETLPLTRMEPAVGALRALLVSGVCGFIGGWLLGFFCRQAAMMQVTLLAALWIPCALVLQSFVADSWPQWYGAALPAILTLATFAGGIAGVALRRSERRPVKNAEHRETD
jgi:hypothetical protein